MAWILVATCLATVSLLGVVGALNSAPKTFIAAASSDTYVSSFAPSTPRGDAPLLWVSSGGYRNWTLLAFDLSGKLHPGDIVVQATMKLTVSEAQGTGFPVVLITGRTITQWTESGTTFDTAPVLGFDTTTNTPVGKSPGPSVSIDLSKQLKRWHSYGGPSNFGTAITMGPASAQAGIAFASRENTQLDKPVLLVVFQPGPHSVYPYALGLADVSIALARPVSS